MYKLLLICGEYIVITISKGQNNMEILSCPVSVSLSDIGK